MTSKLAALAKIFLLPRRSAPAFVRPLQRILNGAITDEIRTEPQENDDDENEQQKEEQQQQQQNKGFLFEALMARRGNLNSNYAKYHQGEGVGPIADPIARYQLREVMNEYYRSAINNNNNNNNNSFIFNIQRQDYQDTSSFSSSAASSSSPDVAVSRTTPDLSSIPVGDEYLYLAQ
jgi:hypothetical protein